MIVCGMDLGKGKDTIYFDGKVFSIDHSTAGWRKLDQKLPSECVLVYEGRCAQLERVLSHRKLYSLEPSTSAKIRKAFMEAKDDARDAKTLAQIMVLRPELFKKVAVRDVRLQDLRDLVRERRYLVGLRTSIQNRLKAHMSKGKKNQDKWLRDFNGTPHVHSVKSYKRICKEIEVLEEEIKDAGKKIPAFNYLVTIKGMGEVLAAEIIAEMDGFEQVESIGEAQAYAGTAPVTMASGSKKVIVLRRRCSRRARNAMYLFAFCSINYNLWARQYYDACRARGKTHSSALLSLANRWMSILYSMAKNRTSYDPGRKRVC
jgi:transposase